MNKLLFTLPRPAVPIFTLGRSSASVVTAAEEGSSRADGSASAVGAWTSSDLAFPVRRVYCVGRNYREHALEMGGDPAREPPFFFAKPADAVVVCDPDPGAASTIIPYPSKTTSLHFEGELIVAIGKEGAKGGAVPVDRALDHVYGYSVGCDLTRRDLQAEAKKKGRPWDTAKGFDHSCPMAPIVPKEHVTLDEEAQLVLDVNGNTKQRSSIGKMVYSVPELISKLSEFFRLRRGDLIMTGTPAGVSNLNVGDSVSITCGGLVPCRFVIGEAE